MRGELGVSVSRKRDLSFSDFSFVPCHLSATLALDRSWIDTEINSARPSGVTSKFHSLVTFFWCIDDVSMKLDKKYCSTL